MLRAGGIMLIDVHRMLVHAEQAEEGVVEFRDGTTGPVLKHLSGLQFLEAAAVTSIGQLTTITRRLGLLESPSLLVHQLCGLGLYGASDTLAMMNNGDFQGDVALITGANKGIGYEIARGLGAKKIRVLVGARDAGRGQAAVDQLTAEGVDARFVKLDVTDRGSMQNAAAQIEREFGRLDILVNNAGIGDWDANLGGAKPSIADMANVRKVYETNVFGPMALTQAMLPLLRKSKHGRIVNVTSSLGSITLATQPDSPVAQFQVLGYNTSKSALNSMTVQFANELKDTPIKVNAICPGYCATDLNHHSGPRSAAQGAVAAIQYATLPDDGPTGGYFNEEGRIPW